MKVICDHRRRRLDSNGSKSRANSVSADVDALLRPKTLQQLHGLERQVNVKLQSDEPIDVEYWEDLLDNIGVYKAKAQLKGVYQSVLNSRLRTLQDQQRQEARAVRESMDESAPGTIKPLAYDKAWDSEPMLKVGAEDKGLKVQDESEFLAKAVSDVFLLLCLTTC